jgi:translation initiation factor 1
MTKKHREGIVYSTNPDFNFTDNSAKKIMTLPANQQQLKVWIDSKSRSGKTVTLVKGYVGRPEDLEILARELKTKCGTGGSVKGKEIIIQGNFREKIIDYLKAKGYKAKKAGG